MKYPAFEHLIINDQIFSKIIANIKVIFWTINFKFCII